MTNILDTIKDNYNSIADKIYIAILSISAAIFIAGLVFVVSWNIHKDDAVLVNKRSEIELLVTHYVGKDIDGELLESICYVNDIDITFVDKSNLSYDHTYKVIGCTDTTIYVKQCK